MAMGGIGEAALISAAIGGGSAAITGGDPLKGALLGGLTGGAGAAFAPALGGMFGGAEAAGLAAAEAAPAAAMTSMAPTVANAAAMNATAAPTALSGFSGAPGTNFLDVPGLPSFASAAPASPGITSLLPNAAQAAPAVAQAAPAAAPAIPGTGSPPSFMEGLNKIAKDPTEYIKDNKYKLGAAALAGAIGGREDPKEPDEYNGPLRRFVFNPSTYRPAILAGGGIASLASGGYDHVVGDEPMSPAGMARGGISDLGGYSDGGRMLRGPGDGMSDSIPASIAGKRPARLANEEFVVPADVVSHLGNGSSDAGAKQLYAMMDRVRQARTGRKSQGREINPRKYMFA